jgi:hypothetical protein
MKLTPRYKNKGPGNKNATGLAEFVASLKLRMKREISVSAHKRNVML